MCSLGTSIGTSANTGPIVIDIPNSAIRRESELYIRSSLTDYHTNQTTDQKTSLVTTPLKDMASKKLETINDQTLNSSPRQVETIEYPTLDLSTGSEYVSDEKVATDSELSYLLTEMSMSASEHSKTCMPYIS